LCSTCERNGDTLWQANGVALSSSANSWAYPSITGYGSDGAIVTWVGVNSEIYAQKIDTSGIVQWSAGGIVLAPKAVIRRSPAITREVQLLSGMITIPIICIRTFCTAGEFRRNSHVAIHRRYYLLCTKVSALPECVSDGNGGAIVGWLDGRSDTASYAYAQKVGAEGITSWAKNGAQVATTNGYSRIRIASDGAGGAMLTWYGGKTTDVYVQRINGNGVPQWANDIRLTENKNPSIPGIISDGSTGVFVVGKTRRKIKLRYSIFLRMERFLSRLMGKRYRWETA